MVQINVCLIFGTFTFVWMMPRSFGTLIGAIVFVSGCSSDAISLLFGRAGANEPSQPRRDYVFKNCPVCVESTEKDLITSYLS